MLPGGAAAARHYPGRRARGTAPEEHQFTRMDVQGLRAVGAQLTGAIENARLLLGAAPTPSEGDDSPLESVATFEGQVASGGLARGPSLRLDREGQYDSLAAADYPPDLVLDDFRAAISATEEQLEEMQAQVGERLSDVASLIFSSPSPDPQGPRVHGRRRAPDRRGVAVPQAVLRISDEYIHRFQSSNVGFVREKANDVKDLVTRLLHNISDAEAEATEWPRGASSSPASSSVAAPAAVVAAGGRRGAGDRRVTSHVAILARSLVVPLVIVDDPRLLVLAPGTDILLDADHGRVYVRPSEAVAAHFGARLAAQQAPEPRGTIEPQTATADGTLVRLMANVNLMSDADLARQLGAEGIGLYRTEFPFMVRRELPTEEEQYTLYRDLVARFPNGDILFRTLDIGGDKVLPYFPDMREQNPFLGVRSIRFSLRNLDIFTQQLRAMLRANRGRKLHVMFPMVTSIEELRAGRAAVEQCAAELREEDHQISTEVAVGAMVEVPSIVPLDRRLRARGRFPFDRNQRPDSVPAGGGPHQREGGSPLPAASPGRAAHAARGGHGLHPPGGAGVGVRRHGAPGPVPAVSDRHRGAQPERGADLSAGGAGGHLRHRAGRRASPGRTHGGRHHRG